MKQQPVFTEKLAAIIQEGNYSAHQVFNVDETSLFWKKKCLTEHTPSWNKKACLGIKQRKSGNAAGDCKLKPLFLYTTENPKSFKGVIKGVIIHTSMQFTTTLDPRSSVTRRPILRQQRHQLAARPDQMSQSLTGSSWSSQTLIFVYIVIDNKT